MAKVEIYTRPMCGFCAKAKKLLDSKGVTYQEYDIWEEDGRQKEMQTRVPGARTVPQILIDDKIIGGCDDLHALDARGGLNPLLGLPA